MKSEGKSLDAETISRVTNEKTTFFVDNNSSFTIRTKNVSVFEPHGKRGKINK